MYIAEKVLYLKLGSLIYELEAVECFLPDAIILSARFILAVVSNIIIQTLLATIMGNYVIPPV
jgi:hypothetical protein